MEREDTPTIDITSREPTIPQSASVSQELDRSDSHPRRPARETTRDFLAAHTDASSSVNVPTNRRRHTFQVLRKIKPALTLENTGSVARDHLAAERTFLAYVRTSLACASAGVALMQLFNLAVAGDLQPNLKRFSRPLGAVMVIFGLFVLSVGTTRYFTIQTALTHGKFPAARYTIALQTLFLCTVVVVVFAILVGVR